MIRLAATTAFTALALAGCGGMAGNRSLETVHQPVVEGGSASVPGCPDWSATSDFNPANATHSNYGCAVQSNLATMVAEPEDLLRGADDQGNTRVMTGTKAIDSYRAAPPTGENGLKPAAMSESGGGQP